MTVRVCPGPQCNICIEQYYLCMFWMTFVVYPIYPYTWTHYSQTHCVSLVTPTSKKSNYKHHHHHHCSLLGISLGPLTTPLFTIMSSVQSYTLKTSYCILEFIYTLQRILLIASMMYRYVHASVKISTRAGEIIQVVQQLIAVQ